MIATDAAAVTAEGDRDGDVSAAGHDSSDVC